MNGYKIFCIIISIIFLIVGSVLIAQSISKKNKDTEQMEQEKRDNPQKIVEPISGAWKLLLGIGIVLLVIGVIAGILVFFV
jgi:hypothetical protein